MEQCKKGKNDTKEKQFKNHVNQNMLETSKKKKGKSKKNAKKQKKFH